MKTQLNSVLFAKTLVKKDVASSAPPSASAAKDGVKSTPDGDSNSDAAPEKKAEPEFSSKAQIMTLMTADVDRVGGLASQTFLIGM